MSALKAGIDGDVPSIHLQHCPGSRTDHDGLLEAARRFGGVKLE